MFCSIVQIFFLGIPVTRILNLLYLSFIALIFSVILFSSVFLFYCIWVSHFIFYVYFKFSVFVVFELFSVLISMMVLYYPSTFYRSFLQFTLHLLCLNISFLRSGISTLWLLLGEEIVFIISWQTFSSFTTSHALW